MNQSEKIDLLAKALVAVQKELKAVARESTNPFYKSKYADLATVIDHAAPSLTKHGLSVAQVCEGEHGVTTILMHESGQFLSGTLSLRPVKDDPQGAGSALTYARRYSYASIIGLASEDDDDGNSATHKEPTPQKRGGAKPTERPITVEVGPGTKAMLDEFNRRTEGVRDEVQAVIDQINMMTTTEEVKTQVESVRKLIELSGWTQEEYQAVRGAGLKRVDTFKKGK